MARFFAFYPERVRRYKPDGDWEWDAPHLRSVYLKAERPYIENGCWRPMSKDGHLAVWEQYKQHLSRLQKGEGDAVEANQPYIDSLLLLQAQYVAAASMPLDAHNARQRVDELFCDLPEHLTAKLFGVTIEEGDHQVVTYRKMVRLGLVFSSDTETVPSSLKGLPDTESLNQPYSTYTNMLDAMLHGLHGNRSNFQESAVKAASSVQSAYAFFLTTQKLAETEIIEVPRNDDGSFDTSGFEDE